MSEAAPELATGFNIKRQIEEIQEEARKILDDVTKGKDDKEIELAEARLQSLIRRHAEQISSNIYVSPDHMLALMTTSAMLTTAWVSFVRKKESVYSSKAYEDRMTLADVLDALDVALDEIIEVGRSSQ